MSADGRWRARRRGLPGHRRVLLAAGRDDEFPECLYRYGLAEVSRVYVETVNRLFAVGQKPMCTISF